MTSEFHRLLPWIPRTLGIVVGLFVGLFALDAFGKGLSLPDTVLEFLIHLLPALIVLTLVALAWRRAWIGAAGFGSLALVYSLTWARGHFDWMLVIAAPLLLVGMLFLWSWIVQKRHVNAA